MFLALFTFRDQNEKEINRKLQQLLICTGDVKVLDLIHFVLCTKIFGNRYGINFQTIKVQSL